MFCFHAYAQVSLKKIKKKIILHLHKKKKVLACILALITGLLKSRELANISKISKKIILFLF
jgi:hypothetical protein